MQNGYRLYGWVDVLQKWKLIKKMGVTRIAVSKKGEVWAIDNKNKVYKDWKRIPGSASEIDIADNGLVFTIGKTEKGKSSI